VPDKLGKEVKRM